MLDHNLELASGHLGIYIIAEGVDRLMVSYFNN